MANITFTLNGQKVKAEKGDTILNAARKAGQYIPTMCYITKTQPIASCRMCVVEVEDVDGFVLSCQAPVVEGAVINTNSAELFRHRQNIMKLYDVNHPLQCGVCDKSGECELQNKTLEFNVSSQEFNAKEQDREIKDWGFVTYDPGLCIMCERCVRVSNEIIGDESLKISAGGYKSTIINTKEDVVNADLGECAAVCPVGALSTKDFKYNTNAWELTQVPAACSHCSAACSMSYEVKAGSNETGGKNKIYRVHNDFEFATLCGSGRFGYNFENSVESQDVEAFGKAVDAFNSADTVRFNSFITNEEAQILQTLKEEKGIKLVNDDARAYQKFMNAFSNVTGKMHYEANQTGVKSSDYIITLGSKVMNDAPAIKQAINIAQKQKKAQVVYMHPMQEDELQNIVTQFVKYEVGTEEGVMAMLASALIEKDKLKADAAKVLSDLDEGYLSAETSIGEEEITYLVKKMARKKNFTLIIGEDAITHPRAENIARLAGLIEKYTEFNVLVIPPQTNTLGVSLICDLDDEAGSKVVGYNESGDFVLSALGDGDLDMPALNQQEGTFTNLDKRVVPTNVALPYGGYTLNDIANELGLEEDLTINYTAKLPTSKGYEEVKFDDLPNHYTNTGEEVRGYLLSSVKTTKSDKGIEEIATLPEYNGTVIYRCEPVLQFNQFTNKAIESEESALIGSEQFAVAAKVKDGDKVEVSLGSQKMNRTFKVDENLKGTIAVNPSFDLDMKDGLALSGYRYKQVKITKIV